MRQKDPLSEFFLHKEPEYRLGGCRVHILRKDFQIFQPRIFKTLQLFVPNSKRLRGLHSVSGLFLWKNAHHLMIYSGKTTSRFLFERTRTRLVSPGKA
jgi:hypothetical protein